MRRWLAFPVVVAAIAFAMSCASSTRLQLQVHVAPDVNDDRPIPVDVVFVWDKATAAKLDALSAKDWFDRKTALRRDDPNERNFTIRDWEWVPGQEVPDIDLSVRATSRRWLKAIYVFANYRTEGPHRARVSPGLATLALQKDDFRIQPLGAAPKAPLSDKEP